MTYRRRKRVGEYGEWLPSLFEWVSGPLLTCYFCQRPTKRLYNADKYTHELTEWTCLSCGGG